MLKRYVFVLAMICNLYALGEQPLLENNIAINSKVFSPNNPSYNVVIDGLKSTTTTVDSVILDLGSIRYLDKIVVYTANTPNVLLSKDIVNWVNVSSNILAGESSYICSLNSVEGRYVRVVLPEPSLVKEITIQDNSKARVVFEDIQTMEGITTCNIIFKASIASTAQVAYAQNFDFIYTKKLTNAEAILAGAREHSVALSNLVPDTTYRYQIKLMDYNGNVVESNYFTFTTKPTE